MRRKILKSVKIKMSVETRCKNKVHLMHCQVTEYNIYICIRQRRVSCMCKSSNELVVPWKQFVFSSVGNGNILSPSCSLYRVFI